jgi:hypothetical protein
MPLLFNDVELLKNSKFYVVLYGSVTYVSPYTQVSVWRKAAGARG